MKKLLLIISILTICSPVMASTFKEAPTNGLVGCWKFDENRGTTAGVVPNGKIIIN